MTLFPFFTDIENKNFLIIGGGNVAAGKVSRLLQFTDRITVIAPDTQISGVSVLRRPFSPEDLSLGDYVIAATDDHELNRQAALLCHRAGIPVNVADAPELCTWYFPAVVKKGDLTVGITTAGSSPAYAGLLRRQIEEMLPEHLEEVLDRMQELREQLPKYCAGQKERRKLLKEALSRLLEDPQLQEISAEELLQRIPDGEQGN